LVVAYAEFGGPLEYSKEEIKRRKEENETVEVEMIVGRKPLLHIAV
jgi:hypothetical protein